MKSASRLTAVAVAVAAATAVSPASASAAPVRDPQSVVVTNDIDNPVIATLVGTPAVKGTVGIDPAQNVVQVSNLPASPPAPTPFQVSLEVEDTGDDFSSCVDVPRPAGKTVRITDVSIQVQTSSTPNADALNAAVRHGALGGSLSLTHPIPLSGSGLFRRGHTSTTLFTGPVAAPTSATYDADVCLLNIEPAGLTRFSALVSGEVL